MKVARGQKLDQFKLFFLKSSILSLKYEKLIKVNSAGSAKCSFKDAEHTQR